MRCQPAEATSKPITMTWKLSVPSCGGAHTHSKREHGNKFWYDNTTYSATGERCTKVVLHTVEECQSRVVNHQHTPLQPLHSHSLSPTCDTGTTVVESLTYGTGSLKIQALQGKVDKMFLTGCLHSTAGSFWWIKHPQGGDPSLSFPFSIVMPSKMKTVCSLGLWKTASMECGYSP